MATSDAARTR